MSAGTINLTNNSKLVEGVGTSFTTDLNAGDFAVSVVGGITYTLAIESIESDTSLTLVKSYTGPTNSANAWNAVPRSTVSAITAEVVAQVTEALRGLNYDKMNWQLIFSGDGDITIRLPDGSEFTGPSWSSLSDQLADKIGESDLSEIGKQLISAKDADTAREAISAAGDKEVLKISNNLNEIKTNENKEMARKNIGLGTSATLDSGNSLGNVLVVGGVGSGDVIGASGLNLMTTYPSTDGFFEYGIALVCSQNVGSGGASDWRNILHFSTTGKLTLTNVTNPDQGGQWLSKLTIPVIGTSATVDANGFIKIASPIVKLFGNGNSELNSESVGVTTERLSEGVYRISGAVMGFNSDPAWDIEVPLDDNKQPLIWIDSFVKKDGDIVIKTYHRTHPSSPIFAKNNIDGYDNGDPIDIPAGRWIDVRVNVYSDDEEIEEIRSNL